MIANVVMTDAADDKAVPASQPDDRQPRTIQAAGIIRVQGIRRLWHFPVRRRGLFSLCGIIVITTLLGGCGGLPPVYLKLGAGDGRAPTHPVGLVAGDEPNAVLVARDILLAGGNAADAAVAMGFSLAVTLPSSAGLGGGGACVVRDVSAGHSEVLDFMAHAAADDGAARYRAAIPRLPRGLFSLHARYGRLPWPQVVAPAENLARFGHAVSQAFARDLAADGGVLTNDRTALTAYMTPRRQILQAGDVFKQIDLATMLGRLRARGPGEPYAGYFGNELQDSIAAAGSAITAAEIRAAVPRWADAAIVDAGKFRLNALPADVGAGDFAAAYAQADRPSTPGRKVLSGSTGFVVADGRGIVVACGLSMGRAFGLGIMPRGPGFLLAPAPGSPAVGAARLAPIIALRYPSGELLFAVAAAGAGAVTDAATVTRELIDAAGTLTATTGSDNFAVGRTSLVNLLVCGASESVTVPQCWAQNDPRGSGYALILSPKE